MFTKEDLKEFQSESLEQKFQRTLAKVSEWYSRFDGEVYVSFSGGKDSTVLADICARWVRMLRGTKSQKPLYLLFVNTGLEYPEIQQHVKYFAEWLRNKYEIEVELEILRPEMRFDEVIKKYGYPLISKEVSKNIREYRAAKTDYSRQRWEMEGRYKNKGSRYDLSKWKPLRDSDIPVSDKCCDVMKKKPAKQYEKKTGRKPLLATMACESALRQSEWLKNGCNAFDARRQTSKPMSFWFEQDVLQYIKEKELPLASVYGNIEYAEDPEQIRIEEMGVTGCGTDKLCTTGCSRTGCIFCAFGAHLEKGEGRFERLKRTHPRQYQYCIGGGEYDENGVWKPNKQGLGMGHVFDELNKIYGEGFIKY